MHLHNTKPPSRGWRSRIALAAAALTAVTLAGCAPAAEPEPGDDSVGSMVVSTGNPSVQLYFPFYAAMDQGFFEAEGLTVEHVSVQGTAAAIQAVSSGQSHVAAGSSTSGLELNNQGSPVKFFYRHTGGIFDLFVPEDSDIKTAADLKGAVIGIEERGSADEAIAIAVLESAGLTEADVTILPIGNGGQAVAGFERGDIDAYANNIIDAAILNQAGYNVRSLAPPEVRDGNGLAFYGLASWVGENGDKLKAFVRGMQAGYEWAIAHPEETVALEQKFNPEGALDTKLTEALRDQLFKATEPADASKPVGYIPEETIQRWVDEMAGNGLIDPVADLSAIYTNEFIE